MSQEFHLSEIPCTRCIITTDVTNLSDLKAGDHISILGRSSRCNALKWGVYRHHMIVTETIDRDCTSGMIKVIAYENCGIRHCNCRKGEHIQEKEVTIDVEVDKCRLITYEDETWSSDERVSNARRIAAEEPKYNLIFNNCEHFCHEVCTGINESRQIERLKEISCLCFMSLALWVLIFLSLEASCVLVNNFSPYWYLCTLAIIFCYVCLKCRERSPFRRFSRCLNCPQSRHFCHRCRKFKNIETVLGIIILIVFQVTHVELLNSYKSGFLDPVVIVFVLITIFLIQIAIPWLERHVFCYRCFSRYRYENYVAFA